VGAEGQAGVVGDVQPLVRVEGPRVGAAGTGDEMAQRRACGGPQAEGPVDVEPRPRLCRGVGDGIKVVEGAGIDLAGLGADDRRHVPGGKLLAQPGDLDPGGTIGGDDRQRSPPDAQEPKGAVDAHVAPGAYQDPDGRGSAQAQLFDVPARCPQDVVSRRGQAGEVGHLAPGDEGERRVLWQPSNCLSQARDWSQSAAISAVRISRSPDTAAGGLCWPVTCISTGDFLRNSLAVLTRTLGGARAPVLHRIARASLIP
jgi:hypothetical protein